MTHSNPTTRPIIHTFTFDDAHCWLDVARVTSPLSSTADRELVETLTLGGRLAPADFLLEQLRSLKAEPGLIDDRGEWLEAMKLVLDKVGCGCGRSRFTESSARVEELIKELQPSWDRGIDMVEVLEIQNTSDAGAPSWFLHHRPDLWMMMEPVPLESLDRILVSYPGHGTTLTIELESNGTTRRLSLTIPADARRAELTYIHTESGPAPDGTPMVEHLNQRPDGDIELLIAVSGSAAPIPFPVRNGAHGHPAFLAHLWEIDPSVRVAGLFDLDAASRNTAIRLCQDWRHTLDELRRIVGAMAE